MGYMNNGPQGLRGRSIRSRMVVLAVLSGLIWTCLSVAAAEELALGLEGEEPTRITSQKLIYNQASKEVEFYGDVHVVRSDFELWCKSMSVFLAEETPSGDRTRENPGIEKIVARDEVRLKMQERLSHSDQAVYEAAAQRLILTGDVLLKEGLNEIQGEKVIFYLDEERSEIFSSEGKRVNAIFYPSKDSE